MAIPPRYEVQDITSGRTMAQCASLKAAERKAYKMNVEYGAPLYRAKLVLIVPPATLALLANPTL